MTDAPERIWAWTWEVDVSRGQWALNPSVGFDEEAQYIRADTAEAEKRAAVVVERQKWEAILKAREAYENGEPSKPPHSGREKTTIAAAIRQGDTE
jgi:hypothetical protein